MTAGEQHQCLEVAFGEFLVGTYRRGQAVDEKEPVSGRKARGRVVSSGVARSGHGANREKELMLRRLIVFVAITSMVLAVSAFTASAGEVTGSGKGGPNGDGIPGSVGKGMSACLYSGLEDGGEYPGQPAGPGETPQNWGHSKDAPFILDSRGASYVLFDATIFGGEPGETVVEGCNPHVGHDDGH